MTSRNDEHDDGAARLEELIGRSSLGTPGARELRARITPAEAARISRIADIAAAPGVLLLAWGVAARPRGAAGDPALARLARHMAAQMVADALRQPGMGALAVVAHQDDGDLLAVSPAGTDVVARIIGALDDTTGEANRDLGPDDRIRIRLALTAGYADQGGRRGRTAGPAYTRVLRLADVAGRVLAESGADFAVMIDASLGEYVPAIALRGRGRLEAPTAAAWVYLPLRPPAVPPGPLADLKALVYGLYLAAGRPPLQEIADSAGGLALDTVAQIIGSPDLPRSPLDLVAVVTVLAHAAGRDSHAEDERAMLLLMSAAGAAGKKADPRGAITLPVTPPSVPPRPPSLRPPAPAPGAVPGEVVPESRS